MYIMKTELKIVKMFIEDKQPKTIREVSKKIGADYRITYFATQKLLEQKILVAQTVGKSTLCSLNESYYGIEIFEAESERKNAILKNGNVNQLYKELLSKIDTKLFVLLLFGSYAKKKQTKNSDIDLLFIANQKNFENVVLEVLSVIPIDVHPIIFSEAEFIRMKDAKKYNVVREAIDNNIILYGIESYYRIKIS